MLRGGTSTKSKGVWRQERKNFELAMLDIRILGITKKWRLETMSLPPQCSRQVLAYNFHDPTRPVPEVSPLQRKYASLLNCDPALCFTRSETNSSIKALFRLDNFFSNYLRLTNPPDTTTPMLRRGAKPSFVSGEES